jgi:hypothetical protein
MMTAMKKLRHLLITLCLLSIATTTFAADPAKTMFGVELGARFLISPCAPGEDTMTSRLCYTEGLTRKTAWGSEEHFVFYPRTAATPWARGEMIVDVLGGFIAAIHINTWGIQGQGTALEALTKKYGPPARSYSKKIAAHRSRYPSKFAEWDLQDFAVRLDGTTSTIDWGRITLITNRHQKLVKSHTR